MDTSCIDCAWQDEARMNLFLRGRVRRVLDLGRYAVLDDAAKKCANASHAL
jgi:hypothetical protein